MNFARSSGVETPISRFDREGEFLVNVNETRSYRFKIDGKEYPVSGNKPGVTARKSMVGRETYEHTMKKDGKLQYTVRTTVLSAGRRRTWSQTRVLADDGTTVRSEAGQELVGEIVDRRFPLVGSWRLIPIARYEMTGEKITCHAGGRSYTAAYDGKDHALLGSAAVDTVALRVVDRQHAVEAVFKKSGVVQMTSMIRVSVDGKSMSTETKGLRADGEAFASTAVCKRMP